MYINAHSTISFQDTFQKEGYSSGISPETLNKEPLHPNYEAFVHVMMRRRMSDAMKMSAACARDCIGQMNGIDPDGIIIGTSMGSSTHTKSFIDTIHAAGDKAISPTAFITSTHNTIAGQLSLILENRGYNITHTQNSLSFEHALFDAKICLSEDLNHVLVGAYEEKENELFSLNSRIGTTDLNVTYGTSFFVVSAEKKSNKSVKIVDLMCHSLAGDPTSIVDQFLTTNNRHLHGIDLLLYCGRTDQGSWLGEIVTKQPGIDYGKLSGSYMTNSGFALDLAVDLIQSDNAFFQKKIRSVLIINNLIPENMGLILIERTEDETFE